MVTHASAVRPFLGLSSCGDAVVHVTYKLRHRFAIIDALGHGPDAEKTALRLTTLILQTADLELAEVFSRCDLALTGTTLRGAAMGVLDVQANEGWFSGVGNIEAYGPPGAKRPICMPGTLGRRVREVRRMPVELQSGSRWVLVSDGLRRRDVAATLELARALSPREAAQRLIVEAARPDDDASAWVVDFGASP